MNRSKVKIESLKQKWFNLLNELEADCILGETIFIELAIAYTDESRYYHNLNHVGYLLELADSVRELAKLPTIKLAAWFHDYVYDPQAQDNEIQSAVYATQTLTRLQLDPDLIESVRQIILSTQKHQPTIDSADNRLFLDLDLAILGESSDRYLKYAQAIRKEYSWLSDRDFQRGRKQVLTKFLAREKIYYTNHFYDRLEQQARANLAQEIELYG